MIHKRMPKSKKRRETIYQILMVVLTYFIYSLFNMTRRPFSIVKLKIIDECDATANHSDRNGSWCNKMHILNTTEEILGLMDFLFTISYGVSLFASGIVADCYNPRFYLAAGCFLSGYFCAVLGLADYWNIRSWEFLGSMLILFGASQSTAWPVVLSSVTHWYGVVGKRRGMFFGFWNTHNYLGSMIGILLAGYWVDYRWMWSFFVPGFILAFAGILVFFCMLIDPKDLKQLEKENSLSARSSKSLEYRLSATKIGQEDIPTWLSPKSSITMYEALKLPGVIEYSICMFFSRIVGYTFLFWMPVFQKIETGSAKRAAYYSLPYVIGGSCGGIIAGILVDLSRQSAVVCVSFLVLSIPIIFIGLLPEFGKKVEADFPLFLITGLFVEAPYVVISTSVSADLGVHKKVKRNDRALSTIGGIIEGSGAVGASLGTFISSIVLGEKEWKNVLLIMVVSNFVAALCLSKLAYKEFHKKKKKEIISDYLKLPMIS